MSNLILAALSLLFCAIAVVAWLLFRNLRTMQSQTRQIAAMDAQLQDKTAHQNLERELNRTLDQSLGGLGQRMHESLSRHAAETTQNLGILREKLGVMDQAQQQFRELGQHVVDLKGVLSNRQARGAIGELQLANLVQQILPSTMYQLQGMLSNNRKPDCLLILPNPPGSIVVDAKFPLEGYRAWVDVQQDQDDSRELARFATDVKKHVNDIAERYIIAGETADFALMYIPAEAVYAEIYASLPKVVDYAFSKKIFFVSPTTLMATLTTVRGIVRDVQLQKHAGEVQKMVGLVAEDVVRLQNRVGNLRKHFDQARSDVDHIETSMNKITSRTDKIAAVEISTSED